MLLHKMGRVLLALFTAFVTMTPPQAYAGHGCWGCNVVDERVFSPYLVGHSLHRGTHNVQVTAVDLQYQTITFLDTDGRQYYAPAREFYTIESDNERVGTGFAIGGVFLCALAGCFNSHNSSSGASRPSSRYTENPNADRLRQCKAQCDSQAYGGYNATTNDMAAQHDYCRRSCESRYGASY